MAGYDVEVIFIIFPFPRRPFFDADFSSTACIANIVAPVSVSPQGAEQSTVKYPLISVPVGLQDAARKCRPHPPNGPDLYFFYQHLENIYGIYGLPMEQRPP